MNTMLKTSQAFVAGFAITGVLLSWPMDAQQSTQPTSVANLNPTPGLVAIGADARTWANELGRTIQEIGTGMNYWNGQGWMPSVPRFVIAPDGSGAVANQMQYQVRLAANINTSNSVSVTTPDGIILNSSPIGIGLYDAVSGSFALIGSITNCEGFLVNSNQAVYSNAFSGVCADIVYTVEKGAFHQDVVFTGQLNPADYGFPSNSTRIQIITEFYSPPQPDMFRTPIYVESNQAVRNAMVSPDLVDEVLGFGEFVLQTGRAWTSASTDMAPNGGAPVAKELVTVNERQLLVESVPYPFIQQELRSLPQCQGPVSPTNAMLRAKGVKLAYAELPLPSSKSETFRLKSASFHKLRVAEYRRPQGVVVDYIATIGGTISSAKVFQSDTTYFVSSTYNCNGATTIEGGTVFKYPKSPGTTININSSLITTTSIYRPATFTAADDNTIGATLSTNNWSHYTGSPSNYYASPALSIAVFQSVTNFHFRYANGGFSFPYYLTGNHVVAHSQFLNCLVGVAITGSNGSGSGSGSGAVVLNFNNSLFSDVSSFLTEGGIYANYYNFVHCTIDGVTQLVPNGGPSTGSFVSATNSIFSSVTNYGGRTSGGLSGQNNGFYASTSFGSSSVVSSNWPFQGGGAGNYYLGPVSPFLEIGTTTGVSSGLIADLQNRTTTPPIILAALTFTNDTTLSPEVPRDNSGSLNLGYHYDPVDFAFGGSMVENATLTITLGTVIAAFDTNDTGYGLAIGPGGELLSQGTPNALNRFVSYDVVQEQPTTNWSTPSGGMLVPNWTTNGPASVINCRFMDFSVPADDTAHLYALAGNTAPINFQDCQFHGGSLTSTNATINLTNCLLERVTATMWSYDTNVPYIRNNLFWRGTNDIQFPGKTNTFIEDNIFDETGINDHGSTGYVAGYNAFVTNYNRLTLDPTTDVTLSSSPSYQIATLGNYYLPTNSTTLIHQGNTNANYLGMYHYTIMTNQVKETTNIISIGYHYIALGPNGLPVSTSGDGIGDYLKDSNGDGIYEAFVDLGNWLTNSTSGDGVNDYIKYIQGRNLNVSNFLADTNGVTGLNVYTPLH